MLREASMFRKWRLDMFCYQQITKDFFADNCNKISDRNCIPCKNHQNYVSKGYYFSLSFFLYTVEPRFWQHFGKHPFVAKIGVFKEKTPILATKDFELLQYQTVSKHAKVTKIFKILFLASKTIGIS